MAEEQKSRLMVLLGQLEAENERHWSIRDPIWAEISRLCGNPSPHLTGPEMDDAFEAVRTKFRAERAKRARQPTSIQ